MTMFERIYDVATQEETMRPYTKEEIKKAEEMAANANKIREEFEAKQQIISDAKSAILNKLGITEEEAKLLLS